MSETEYITLNDAEPGKIKLYNPYEKAVSTDNIVLTDDTPEWNCTLVDPDHPQLVQRADVNPFKVEADWQQREAEMFQLMHDRIGVGLAANQIGQPYRMFVMHHSHLKDIGVYNPVILETEGEVDIEEGCLTWPLLYFRVKRAEKIKVRFTKTDSETDVEMWMDGMDARCFLHELDHLNGVVYLEHAGELKLKRAKERRDKYLKKLSRKIASNKL
jgi:peptide deformylase